ncbi:threonylcarbamoyl-AMP synthase [Chitinophaga parva]|uniref:L-threonylcarbamoyladenylate synthase n=1 Tax=Chitinophaga parva TaxID=2169414 RepID=A0A2T7BCU1_9BACT|nr:threonylcarbamoyl-AMP synthase [Chitinophaga parva]
MFTVHFFNVSHVEVFEEDLVACLEALRAGGTILYPTDTIWGLGCDATDENAVRKIFDIKQRPAHKSLVVLLADVKSIFRYVAHPHPDLADILAAFDRPTTVIYDGALHLAPSVINADGSVAIRLVQEPFCRHLVKRLRKPLVSTSANLSGQPSAPTFADVSPEVKQGVDYIVNYRQTDTTPATPSRIVKIRENGELEVIRG